MADSQIQVSLLSYPWAQKLSGIESPHPAEYHVRAAELRDHLRTLKRQQQMRIKGKT